MLKGNYVARGLGEFIVTLISKTNCVNSLRGGADINFGTNPALTPFSRTNSGDNFSADVNQRSSKKLSSMRPESSPLNAIKTLSSSADGEISPKSHGQMQISPFALTSQFTDKLRMIMKIRQSNVTRRGITVLRDMIVLASTEIYSVQFAPCFRSEKSKKVPSHGVYPRRQVEQRQSLRRHHIGGLRQCRLRHH